VMTLLSALKYQYALKPFPAFSTTVPATAAGDGVAVVEDESDTGRDGDSEVDCVMDEDIDGAAPRDGEDDDDGDFDAGKEFDAALDVEGGGEGDDEGEAG
jgi:hypothetical protein